MKKILITIGVFFTTITLLTILLLNIAEVDGKLMWGKRTKHVGGDGGSMYPTLSWCDYEGGMEDCSKIANTQNRRVAPEFIIKDSDFKPEHQMIVEIPHDGYNLAKRIVGLPGDVLKINDGYLYVNGEKLDEPYLWKPGMTYGGSFLGQCKEVTIPNGKMLVMGDNRPLSFDGSEFGLLEINSVVSYLPYNLQNEFNQLWDTFEPPHLMTTQESNDFIAVVNKARLEQGLGEIALDSKLSDAAQLISDSRVKELDFSPTPEKPGTVRVTDALIKTGYRGNENFYTVTVFGAYDLETYTYLLPHNESFRSHLMKPEVVKIGMGVSKATDTSADCLAGISSIIIATED